MVLLCIVQCSCFNGVRRVCRVPKSLSNIKTVMKIKKIEILLKTAMTGNKYM